MAIITMPTNIKCAQDCRIEQVHFDAVSASDVTGSSQARTYGAPHWALSLTQPGALTDAEAGVWKAMLLSLRGSVNYLHAFDPNRRKPFGTLRGSLTLAASAVYGDAAIILTGGAGQSGATLAAGDWLQIGAGLGTSQLVNVTSNATANAGGVISVLIESPLRMGFASGSVVTWDHARAYFRRPPGRVGWSPYAGRYTQGLATDLMESW
jgi:hypothetical protein